MARIRSIHPGIFTDEAWVSCAPLTRVLFMGLLTDADDQGIFEWKPLQLRMRLLPGDAADIAAMLDEMAAVNLIKAFEHSGKKFGAIRNFSKHQRPKKPNSIHFVPEDLRTYVNPPRKKGEVVEDEDGQVGNQFPTSEENSPQMEDGGWRMEDVSDASASSPGEGEQFASLWKAYPHTKGRSSPPKSEMAFRAAPAEDRPLLAKAAEAFAKSGTVPQGGAPALEKWLADERYRDWLSAAAPIAAPTPRADGSSVPADVREVFLRHRGHGWTGSYIDKAVWVAEGRIIVPRTNQARVAIQADGKAAFGELAEAGNAVRLADT